MKNIIYNIAEVVSILSESSTSDWVLAITKTQWNNKGEYKLDIRHWNMDYLEEGYHEIDTSKGFVKAFSKGITLTDDEFDILSNIGNNGDIKDNDEVKPEVNHVPDTMEDRFDLFCNIETNTDRIFLRRNV